MSHTLPAIHALHLAQVVKQWNVEPSALLEPFSLREEQLAEPSARLPVDTIIALVERARALTGEAALGSHLGLEMRVSAHGFLGFAAMTSATVREALELAVKFAPTRTTAIGLRLQIDAGSASLVIDEHADFGSARDVVIMALMVGISQIGNAVTGRMLEGTADFAFPEPEYFHRFRPFSPPVRFDQPVHRLLFDASLLDLPLTLADPAAQRLATEQCERALDALGLDARIAPRVRALIARDDGGVRSLDEIASAMHVSARTLKRRLAAEGVAYSVLLEEERRDRALLLLRARDVSLDEVADRLGYSDVANFTRAFRRWTGSTPAAYRRAAPGVRDRRSGL